MSFGKGGNPYSLDKFFSGPDLLRADGGIVCQKIWQKYRIAGRSLRVQGDARQVGGSDEDRGGAPDMVQLDETFFGVFLNGPSPFVDLTNKLRKSELDKNLHPRRLRFLPLRGRLMGFLNP